jgi:Zn-dependent peptidase ImmA (M78 family)/DNA-binding XRE family transcriptional regulator
MARKSLEVSINPEIIKWARESAGWSVEEISKKLKTSKENYEKIESGKKPPTFRQLEILAHFFKRPVAVFFLPQPPEEPAITSSFRILPKSKPEFSKDLRLAIRKARYYQSITNELMKDLGIVSKPKIKTLTLQDNPQESAREERKKIGVSLEEQFKWKNAYSAFNAWRAAIESRNILVFQFKFPIEDARGFSLMDKEPPVIAINSDDNILARIFTLFHEFAHIILGITEIYGGEEGVITDKNVENWCDSFASEFLIPEEVLEEDKDFQSFKQTSPRIPNPELLQNLSKKFRVSQQAILTRLRTLNLIEYDAYRMVTQTLKKQYVETSKKSRFKRPSFQKCLQEKGKKFISIILASKERGIITTADVIDYLSVKHKYLDIIAELSAK